ncbi:hypothetical protein G7Z17_g285 [Cylindrodendrum hubeiense]|uniref:Rhodopsin domain-containing protein n=1 Tax=Cylindrodendrum hubeiense TaxID=595255 RepID=A0A9P5HLY6_9HYPO|nr:hypothetical protein G7Z17_g285 [Cylindrodendrum hubeiense]
MVLFVERGPNVAAAIITMWFFLFEVFYCINVIFVKLSIGMMLVRIAKNRKTYAYVQYGVMGMFTTMNLIAVAGILGLGFFASLSACIRLKYTVNLTAQHDYLYALSDIVIWGYAENGLGLIVGCLTTLRPLFRKLLNLGSETSKWSGGKGGNNSGFPKNLRRTYKDTTTEASGGRNSDTVFETESQRKMLSGSDKGSGDI